MLIVGAGIGGLSTGLHLAAEGFDVTIIEAHERPGGKIRTLPTEIGPVDTGPTVVTLLPFLSEPFSRAGLKFADYVDLTKQPVLARHFWQDGSTLDLCENPEENVQAVSDFAGVNEARRFKSYCERTARLFAAFKEPLMESSEPNVLELTAKVLKQPQLILDMAPLMTMAQDLRFSFKDPRLRQLFGRYATYVGGSPFQSPALLGLIWHAEASGVWTVKGGLSKIVEAFQNAITDLGGSIRFNASVNRIRRQNDRAEAVVLDTGETISADAIVFNGDPRAIASGTLGNGVQMAVSASAVEPRSLSAHVWAFAARPSGVPLAHHNVFFGHRQKNEFSAIRNGEMPEDPTLYVCAQDVSEGAQNGDLQRFEIIMNAPSSYQDDPQKEFERCHKTTFQALKNMGLTFDQLPGRESLTTPQDFETLFPASAGSLYGQSPHGMTAALKRPRARTNVHGLYLAGGGAHPGAGVPMAALSGKHAAEAILKDLTSTSTCHQTDTRGGISTVSATTEAVQYRS